MRVFDRFRNNRQGSISTVFALSIIPIVAGVGIAADYSRAMQVKTRLQSAVDSTLLMLAREAPKKSQGELSSLGKSYFAALMAKYPDVSAANLAVTKGDKLVSASVTGMVPTLVAGIFGIPTWEIAVDGTSAFGGRKLEIVLVLDNTGSMQASNKIGELKKASHALIDMMKAASQTTDQVKVSLVPYTTRVNLGTSFKNETWLTNTPTGTFSNNAANYKVPATRDLWAGCVADRDKGYNNGVKPVSVVEQSKYPMVNCADGLARAIPLTDDWKKLKAGVDAMKADGWTNITLGAQWGYEMLSKKAPFSEASGAGDTERFMILLTDGNNTVDRWTAPGTEGWGSTEATMNNDTRAVCDAITERGVPDASKTLRIKLYTVLVIAGNEPLLKNCASSPAMYFKVNQANQLESVFKKIAEDIGTVRLTM